MDFIPQHFIDNLGYMGKGMLAIFVVIGVIIIATTIVNKICSSSHHKQDDNAWCKLNNRHLLSSWWNGWRFYRLRPPVSSVKTASSSIWNIDRAAGRRRYRLNGIMVRLNRIRPYCQMCFSFWRRTDSQMKKQTGKGAYFSQAVRALHIPGRFSVMSYRVVMGSKND